MNAGTAITSKLEIVTGEIVLAGQAPAPCQAGCPTRSQTSRAPFGCLYSPVSAGTCVPPGRGLGSGTWNAGSPAAAGAASTPAAPIVWPCLQWRQYTCEQLGVMHLWQVTDQHVQQWINHLTQRGMTKRTIGARLAACSSVL